MYFGFVSFCSLYRYLHFLLWSNTCLRAFSRCLYLLFLLSGIRWWVQLKRAPIARKGGIGMVAWRPGSDRFGSDGVWHGCGVGGWNVARLSRMSWGGSGVSFEVSASCAHRFVDFNAKFWWNLGVHQPSSRQPSQFPLLFYRHPSVSLKQRLDKKMCESNVSVGDFLIFLWHFLVPCEYKIFAMTRRDMIFVTRI